MTSLLTADHAYILAAIIMILLLFRALREPYQLEITQTDLKGPQSDPGKPFDTLKIAFISDLHAEWIRISPARLKEALLAIDFDYLLFGGDLTGRFNRPERAQPWLDVLEEVLKIKQRPAYAVIGNHDSARSLELLEAAGIQVLNNRSVILEAADGGHWQLAGLDILKKGQPDFDLALSSSLTAPVPASHRIVLAHNPDTIWQIPDQQAQFFLAGHFHGGQIYLPFHLEFFLLRREKIGRMGYYEGRFTQSGLICYISRGLGNVLFPLRLGSKPEIACLTLLSQSSVVYEEKQ